MLRNNVEYKRFVWNFDNVINLCDKNKSYLFLCIGTTSIIGDAFGPVVGTILKQTYSNKSNIVVIGDIYNSVNYTNINENIKLIKCKYKNNIIIVLDSALSCKQNIGKVYVENRGLKYAESLRKDNNIIGDISIKAVVGENTNSNINNFKNLKSTSLDDIKNLSAIVSNGIIEVMNKREINGKNIYKK